MRIRLTLVAILSASAAHWAIGAEPEPFAPAPLRLGEIDFPKHYTRAVQFNMALAVGNPDADSHYAVVRTGPTHEAETKPLSIRLDLSWVPIRIDYGALQQGVWKSGPSWPPMDAPGPGYQKQVNPTPQKAKGA